MIALGGVRGPATPSGEEFDVYTCTVYIIVYTAFDRLLYNICDNPRYFPMLGISVNSNGSAPLQLAFFRISFSDDSVVSLAKLW